MSAQVINELKRTIAEAAAAQQAATMKLAALEHAQAERQKKHAEVEAEYQAAVALIERPEPEPEEAEEAALLSKPKTRKELKDPNFALIPCDAPLRYLPYVEGPMEEALFVDRGKKRAVLTTSGEEFRSIHAWALACIKKHAPESRKTFQVNTYDSRIDYFKDGDWHHITTIRA
jgi:hypothetical protein